MNLHTCCPASSCVTRCVLFSPGDSKPSSSSASGANQIRSYSSLLSGLFFISVTSGMMSLPLAAGPPVTSFCLGKFWLLHHLWQKCWRLCITKQKARRNRARAIWTLVFLDSPSKFPSLSSLLKELSSKAMKRLSTWGGEGGDTQGEWELQQRERYSRFLEQLFHQDPKLSQMRCYVLCLLRKLTYKINKRRQNWGRQEDKMKENLKWKGANSQDQFVHIQATHVVNYG